MEKGEEKGLSERVFTAIGFTKMSDEEHLGRLRTTREVALRQIEKLEREEAEKAEAKATEMAQKDTKAETSD